MPRAEDSSDSSDIEVEEADNNEWWDNFQEDPSFLEVSVNSAQESERVERHTRRQSSTRDNLLENSPRQLIRPFVFVPRFLEKQKKTRLRSRARGSVKLQYFRLEKMPKK